MQWDTTFDILVDVGLVSEADVTCERHGLARYEDSLCRGTRDDTRETPYEPLNLQRMSTWTAHWHGYPRAEGIGAPNGATWCPEPVPADAVHFALELEVTAAFVGKVRRLFHGRRWQYERQGFHGAYGSFPIKGRDDEASWIAESWLAEQSEARQSIETAEGVEALLLAGVQVPTSTPMREELT